MDDGLAGAVHKLSEPYEEAVPDGQVHRGYSNEFIDDYHHALLPDANAHAQHLGSSLGLERQPYAIQQSFTAAPRLKTDSSQRTLSVENYQINEERASKRPKRLSSQVAHGASALMRSSDQGNGEAGRRCASRSAASSINYSESIDNDMIAQQMSGQLIAMPTKYFDNQQSIPSDVMMYEQVQRTPEQKSTSFGDIKCSRSFSKTKVKREPTFQTATSPTRRGSRSRNGVPRTQSRRSRKKDHSEGKSKSRKHSRNSAKKKSRSQSNRSRSRSLKRSNSNVRLKSRQVSRHAVPLHAVHSPGSSSALLHL